MNQYSISCLYLCNVLKAEIKPLQQASASVIFSVTVKPQRRAREQRRGEGEGWQFPSIQSHLRRVKNYLQKVKP